MKGRDLVLVTILIFSVVGEITSRENDVTEEKELRRTKRNIYQVLLQRRDNNFIDMQTPTTTKKPLIIRHMKEIRYEILLNQVWRDEMKNKTSPEFKLLSGNFIDAISNELNADFNYVTSHVMKLRKGKKDNVLADIASKFFITEVNSQRHLQGIVGKGWISGESVDPNFFKLLGTQKNEIYEPSRSRPVGLHVKPALLNVNTETKADKTASPTKKHQEQSFNLQYKEIMISIKMAQVYQEYLNDKQSPEYLELSGNVEQAVKKVLTTDEFFLNCTVIEFSESGEGKTICLMSIKFRHEEKFVIEKCQGLITNGNIDGMPVDDHFFRVNSFGETDEAGENMHSLTAVDGKIPQPVPGKYKLKLLPLHYVEIQFSIKINETWNDELSDNQTIHYTIFSGKIEQAVDRALADNPNYIDCNVVEFMESSDKVILTNIAVRLHQNETQPEATVRNVLVNGSISGIPIDPSFFAVFSISYRIKAPDKIANQTEWGNNYGEGQKQQAQTTDVTSVKNDTRPLPTYQQTQPFTMAPPPSISPTPCQQYRQNAEDGITNGQQIGTFIPQCQSDGAYKPVQCHALTGFCWCVDNTGSRIQGTEQRYKEPSCGGIRIHGNVSFPSNHTVVFPPGSCLTVYIQELIVCGPGVDCRVPLAANQTFQDIKAIDNQVPFDFAVPKLKPASYVISGIINNGWCRTNSLRISQLVHQGDFHSTSNEVFVVGADTKEVEKDFSVEPVTDSEVGIRLHGNIILPNRETTSSFGSQSCVSMETKMLKPCVGSSCGKLPDKSNHTIDVFPINSNIIPYEVHLVNVDEGTYVISVVIHTGNCEHDDSQAISDGDFFNEDMQEFVITPDTNDIEKDIQVVKLNQTEDGTTISGRVLLPPATTELFNGSCLSVSSRKLIKCKNNLCKIPPVASKTWEEIEFDARGIPYSLFLPVSSPGSYLVSAVINNGWCKSQTQGSWIREGDFFNDKIHDFEIKYAAQPIGRNIQTNVFIPSKEEDHKGNKGLIINGRVELPVDPTYFLSPRSCLVVKVLPDISKCNGTECIDYAAVQVFKDLHLEGNSIPYFVTIQHPTLKKYLINVVLNVGWCPDKSSNITIIPGDFYNAKLTDVEITNGEVEAEIDMQLTMFDSNSANKNEATTTPRPATAMYSGNVQPVASANYGNAQPTKKPIYGYGQQAALMNYGSAQPTKPTYYGNAQQAALMNYGNAKPATSTNYGNAKPETSTYYGSAQQAASANYGNAQPTKPTNYGNAQQAALMNYGNAKPATSTNYGNAMPETSTYYGSAQQAASAKYENAQPKASNNSGSAQPATSASYKNAQPATSTNYGNAQPVASTNYGSAPATFTNYGSKQPAYDTNKANTTKNPAATPAFYPAGDTSLPNYPVKTADSKNTIVPDTLNKSLSDASSSVSPLPSNTTSINAGNTAPLYPANITSTSSENTALPSSSTNTGNVGNTNTSYNNASPPSTIAGNAILTYPVNTTSTNVADNNASYNTGTSSVNSGNTKLPYLVSPPSTNTESNIQPSPLNTSSGNAGNTINPYATNKSSSDAGNIILPYATNTSLTNAENKEIPYTTGTLPVNAGNTVPSYAANTSLVDRANTSFENTGNPVQYNLNATQTPSTSEVPKVNEDDLVALPKGLPKSCAEIKDAGIGNMDGQYIVEARQNCHLTIICQDMQGQNPKEFLGGPNEDEFNYWHFAVLIKISQEDKEDISDGACLEKSERGKVLLKRILAAGASQDNPIEEWKTTMAKLLRAKRNIPQSGTVITKAKTIYRENTPAAEWGVL